MHTDTTFKSNKTFVYYTVKLGFVSLYNICRRVSSLIQKKKKYKREHAGVWALRSGECISIVQMSSNFFCCISKDDKIIFIITYKI